MNHSLFFLSLLLSTVAVGQIKDTRAKVAIQGRIRELSISPDERIWLVTNAGNAYYTKSIYDNWHNKPFIFKNRSELDLDKPFLDKVSFFTKDTAILTGQIADSNKVPYTNGIYCTSDAGNTWNMVDFGENFWLHSIYTDKVGHAWITNSTGKIYYSSNFGRNWDMLNTPANFPEVYSISMRSPLKGIAGSLHNALYTTEDNWKTVRKIETPLDQKRYKTGEGPPEDFIRKVYFWGDYIVIQQNENFYFTKSTDIDWQPFPIQLMFIDIDETTNQLVAVTKELKVVSFSSPDQYTIIQKAALLRPPVSIKAVNNSLFILDMYYELYKINTSEFTHVIPYTTDYKIDPPTVRKHVNNLTWGVTENHLYLSENNGIDWYRESVLDVPIADLSLENDSIAILWDGIKTNYLYSLKEHKASAYLPKKPLEKFLSYPVKSFTISSGSKGCFHIAEDAVTYSTENADSRIKCNNLIRFGIAE